MVKIDIVSGFLGAGKTTLIKKLLQEALGQQKVVLIENEFGEIGIDGGFLKDAGIEMKEMNSGCICCSLVGDFGTALQEVIETYSPHRILIEPSGVGKLSDVIKAVQNVADGRNVVLNSATVVVDGVRCQLYSKNFGEFFKDQIIHGETIILSRTDKLGEDKVAKCVELLRSYHREALIVTTPWEQLEGSTLLEAMEKKQDLAQRMQEMREELQREHQQEEENGICGHGQAHGEEGCSCGSDHEHEAGDCTCGCHHHHHAHEIFSSFGLETPIRYGKEELETILEKLEEESRYGLVLRAKGIVASADGGWLCFDYVPGERNVREGKAEVTGKICVIGTQLIHEHLEALWKRGAQA